MKNIQTSLLAAMTQVAKVGIAKTSRANLGGGTVNYRGIEEAMNTMSVILIQCGITVTPEYSDLSVTERAKAEGKATRFCTLKGSFKFAAEDGSSVTSTVYGEAMDSGDKCIVKAQSVAFRTALFQQFVVPTMALDPEADGDGDEDDLLTGFRNAALEGEAALRKYHETHKPTAKFWATHQASLKAAAKEADNEKVPA
mgnify:FL=1